MTSSSRSNPYAVIAALWLALFAARIATLSLFQPSWAIPAAAEPAPLAGPLAMGALADLLLALALWALARDSGWRGWRLAVALAAVPPVAGTINVLEALLFLPDAMRDAPALLAANLVGFAIVAAAARWAFARHGSAAERAAAGAGLAGFAVPGLLWRLLAAGLLYAAIYFVAGVAAYAFPEVRAFYATVTVPPLAELLAVQALVRGPAFALLCLLIVRLGGGASTLRTALCFAAASAVAPLLVPTSYFPDAVRWVHFGEVTVSNLLFGAAMARLWRRAAREP